MGKSDDWLFQSIYWIQHSARDLVRFYRQTRGRYSAALNASTATAKWDPIGLRRTTIYVFIGVFAFLMLALEILFALSETNEGLVPSKQSNLRYLWTYGPAAIATVLAAAWACVDYAARVSTPWIRIHVAEKGNDDDIQKSLLLDYISPLPILVPLRALRNRDMLVAATSTISLLCAVMIVLGPALIQLTEVNKEFKNAQVETTTAIRQDDPSRLYMGDPYIETLFKLIGVSRLDMEEPAGVERNIVYQTVDLWNPDAYGSGHPSQITAEVDAFQLKLDCEVASLESFEMVTPPNTTSSDSGPKLLIPQYSLSSPGCKNWTVSADREAKAILDPAADDSYAVNSSQLHTYSRIMTGRCHIDNDNLEDWESYRMAWVISEINITSARNNTPTDRTVDSSAIDVKKSVQMLCKPRYSDIVQVETVTKLSGYQGDRPPPPGIINYIVHSDPTKEMTPHPLTAWHIANATLDPRFEKQNSSFDGFGDLIREGVREGRLWWYDEDGENDDKFDYFSQLVLGIGNPRLGYDNLLYLEPDSVFNYTSLNGSLRYFYETAGTFLMHLAAVEPSSDIISGSVMVIDNRLVIQDLACHGMAGLCLLALVLLVTVVLPRLPRAHLPLRADPGSILGVAVLARGLRQSFPKGLGSSDAKELKKAISSDADTNTWEEAGLTGRTLTGSKAPPNLYQPLPLHLFSRSLANLVCLGIIITLEVLLHTSNRKGGIGRKVWGDTYLRYLWTSVPTLVLSLVRLFFSSLDTELRNLVPLHALATDKGGSTKRRSVGLNLRGMLAPQVLYRELKTGHHGAAAATLTAMLVGLLTITSGSMFYEVEAPDFIPTPGLRLSGSFSSALFNQTCFVPEANITEGDRFSKISNTLLLSDNVGFGSLVYQDMAFPELTLEMDRNTIDNNGGDDHRLLLHAKVPILRGGLTCQLYKVYDIDYDTVPYSPQPSRHRNQTVEGTEASFFDTAPAGTMLRLNISREYCPSEGWSWPEGRPPETDVSAWFLTRKNHTRAIDKTLNDDEYGVDDDNEEWVFGAAYGNNMDHAGRIGPPGVRTRCSDYLYTWGSYTWDSYTPYSYSDYREGLVINRAWALGCNDSIEASTANATFIYSASSGPDDEQGGSLSLYPDDPPFWYGRPVSKVVTPPGGRLLMAGSGEPLSHDLYGSLQASDYSEDNLLDSFFTLLTTTDRPYGSEISAEELGTKCRYCSSSRYDYYAEQVSEAIKAQHGYLMAQLLATRMRIHASDSNGTAVADAFGLVNDTGVFANVTSNPSPQGHQGGSLNGTVYQALAIEARYLNQLPRRVVQDAGPTRIVQGLLVATLLFSLVNWVLAPKAASAVLPRPPTSVASVLALLVDGDLYDHYGRVVDGEGGDGATSTIVNGEEEEYMADGKEESRLAGSLRFWMGLGRGNDDVSDTSSDVDGGSVEKRFGIWVSDGADDSKQSKV